MTVLVTGCAGFIGWKVCERLARDGHQVLGLDNFTEAYDVRLKEWRLSRLRPIPAFRFQRGDVSDREALRRLCREHGVEAVVNLAARAGVRQSLLDPWVYYSTNVVGTLNLLECCREFGIRKLVLASTSSVYGGAERPFREDQPADRPLSPYAASKKAAEELCYAYHHNYGIDVTVLRYFTVYGPASRPDMAVFRFVRWIAEGEPLVLYGDGSQERDFTYVDDIASGTALALRPVGYRVVNLGSDRPVPVSQVITLLEGLLGKRASVERRLPHPADAPATWADITRARGELGWEPAMPLAQGLARAVEWYQENRAWASRIAVGEAPAR
jgi:UDP-glucuronate 4-epimerase